MDNTPKSKQSPLSQYSDGYADLRRFRPVVKPETMLALRRAGFNGPVGWLTEDEAQQVLRSRRRRGGH